MNELAEYKSISLIKLSDGTEIQTEKSPDEVLQVLNSGVKFVKIDGKVINVNAIWTIDKKEASDIDEFLLGITDEIIKKRLKYIISERENKGFKTNGIKHLIQIYENKYGEFKVGN